MIPVNQVILGGDPLLGSSMIGNSIDEQLQMLEKYKQNLEAARQMKQQQPPQIPQQRLIWDEIDSELNPMSVEQKNMMFQNQEYAELYAEIQTLVNEELLNLVKARIESTPRGKDLLSQQLKIVKRLKGDIIANTNKEMEMFRKFKEFSKNNPDVTYEEFIKANM